MPPGHVEPRPQLLTYPDSLGGGLSALAGLLGGRLTGLFRGVHILPPFPSSGDRGFAPVSYDDIDPAFGSWADIERIAADHDVLLDLMVNHISRRSREFRDFQRLGRESPFADLFITLDKIWSDGEPPAEDVARIFLRKPNAPFSTVTIERTGAGERIWTSFGTADWSEQIDLDVQSPLTRTLITSWLRSFAGHGVRLVRLDAVGYVTKEPGTSCFMVEPQIWDFLEWITEVAGSLDLVVLPEVHDVAETHRRLSTHGFWTYDFVLPGLLLHTFASRNAGRLATHLDGSPDRQFTMLDCHDGIPVRPDLDGILSPAEMVALADGVAASGGNVNSILSKTTADSVDVHQLNCTYYSALDCDDERYVAARAVQLFSKGVPQVYYVGLLAGANDDAGVRRTGDGRAINRHDYRVEEIDDALRRPVVGRIVDLIRLRNGHPAFDGEMCAGTERDGVIRLEWRTSGADLALEVDFVGGRAALVERGRVTTIAQWGA